MSTTPLTNMRTVGQDINTRLTSLENVVTSGTVASATKAVSDKNGDDISATYLRADDAQSTYLSKTDATNTYVTGQEAASFLKQTDASSQYLSKDEASTNYLNKSDASTLYLGKTDTAVKSLSIPLVIPNETSQIATLTATVEGITSLYDGLIIAFRSPFSTLASSTLDINGFGAKPIYYQATTTSASCVTANAVVLLVYETVTATDGCQKIVQSYQTDNTARQYQTDTDKEFPILTRYNNTDKSGTYETTYARFAQNVTLNPANGTITAPGGILDSTGGQAYVKLSGSRGQIAGSETVASLSGSQTITIDSADTTCISTSGATTLTFTAAEETVCAVKVIALKATAATTMTYSGASWANGGAAPTWGTANKILILIANFIYGQVILGVAHNGETV